MQKIRIEHFFAAISIFLWASISTVTKLMLNDLTPMQILFVGCLFALIFIFIVCAVTHRLKLFSTHKPKDFLIIAFIGMFGIFFYQLFFCLATSKMLAQEAFIINYLWPISTVIFAAILLKEKLTFSTLIGLFVSFLGVAIVLTKFDISSISSLNFQGVICALGAALSYGLFCALTKKFRYDEIFSMLIYLIVAVIISGIYLLVNKEFAPIRPVHLLGVSWIGIFTNAVPLITWSMALKLGNTAKISNLAFITPFLSLIYIYFFLSEPISIYSVIGLAVIVLGVVLQMKLNKKTV